MNVKELIRHMGSGAYQISAEYQAVLTYATSQGWTLPTIEQQRIANNYITKLVSSGLWAKKRVIWLFATDGDRNFGKVNYKSPGTFTCTEVGTPVFTTNYGFASDGSGYLNTNFKLVTNAGGLYAAGSCHVACATGNPTLTSVGNDNYIDLGVSGASQANGVSYGAAIGNLNVNSRLNSNSTTTRTYDGLSYGWFEMVRRTASANTIFRQKNFVKDNLSNTSVTPSDLNLYINAYNINGVASFHSQRNVNTVQIGTELSDAEMFLDREYWGEYIEGIQGTRKEVDHGAFRTYETTLTIIATRDNYQFASDGYNLRWSNDWGATWTIYPFGEYFVGTTGTIQHSHLYSVTGAHIWASGTLTFTVAAKIYRSTDGLATAPTQITPQHADGSPYTLHTPANSIRPGNNFGWYDIEPVPSTLTSGAEILVWGTYANVIMGAAPVNIWYSIDDGATVKSAYEFGQNTQYRDDGTDDGGTTGTLLGNAGSSIIVRHVHCVTRNPGTLDWYILTGDDITTHSEIRWLKITYNEGTNTWGAPVVLYTAPSVNEWKSVNLSFNGSDLYFASDGGGLTGVYRTNIANIGNTAGSTRVLSTALAIAGLKINYATGYMVVIPLADYILVSQNLGSTYSNFSIVGADVTTARMAGFSNKDSRGYIKFNVSLIGINHYIKTVWIKEN